MGHWSDDLLDEVVERAGPGVDRSVVVEALAVAGREIDLLSGRTFQGAQQSTSAFDPNGLPFVAVPNVHIGSDGECPGRVGDPRPVNPVHAEVLQLMPLEPPIRRAVAVAVADALSIAGQLVAEASQAGLLSGDFVLH